MRAVAMGVIRAVVVFVSCRSVFMMNRSFMKEMTNMGVRESMGESAVATMR